ncbi:MAG: xanthine dehydrogenase family protein [Clostridiaceae bacterium]|nr:xanthine dehydrogenase family protein [Clostridiaceae bacterium]HZJ90578.1 xanthine dehydrogenase family protein molybdopterin-binding subunit [Oscillospiraceae bacterium]
MKTHTIGKSKGRIDAEAKVSGRAEFGSDIRLPDLVYLKGVYSEYASAKLLAVHTEEAKQMPGVVCVVTGADIPGERMIGELFIDQYPLAYDRVRYLGDVIAVVAAETQEQANDAAALVTADYEPLPLITSPKEGLESELLINPECPNNICGETHTYKGDAKKAIQESEVVIEANYKTDFVEHAYIEPEAVVAIPSKMRPELIIQGSTHAPYNARISIARTLNLPMAQVIMRPSTIGGSFGGKIETAEAMAVRAGLVALKTGRPAKYVLTREESMRESYKRHPIEFDIKVGANSDGTLKALHCDALMDSGAYTNMSPPVSYKTATLGPGPYRWNDVHYTATGVLTNNNHTGSFRGFGTPQAIFALENTMDVLADKLGLTPTELRRKNLLRNGDTSGTGHVLDFHEVSILKVMENAVEELDFDRKFAQYKEENKDPKRRIRRGVGIAVAMRGASIGADGNGFDVARILIEVMQDASVHVNLGLVELGQGMRTAQQQMVAEGLGVTFERVTMAETDTSRAPVTGACIASRGTMLGGGAIREATNQLKDILVQGLKKDYGEDIGPVTFENDKVLFDDKELSFDEVVKRTYHWNLTPTTVGTYTVPIVNWDEEKGYGAPFFTYTYSCHAAEVEVDLDLGTVEVIKMVGSHDPGRAINPTLLKGQIYGGMAMAQGMALLEDLGHNPKTGALKNLNFSGYLLPTVLDVPDINQPLLEENPDPRSAFGGRSMGEPSLEPGIGAVTCAVNMALGKPGMIKQLPFDLDSVFEAAQELWGEDDEIS